MGGIVVVILAVLRSSTLPSDTVKNCGLEKYFKCKSSFLCNNTFYVLCSDERRCLSISTLL